MLGYVLLVIGCELLDLSRGRDGSSRLLLKDAMAGTPWMKFGCFWFYFPANNNLC